MHEDLLLEFNMKKIILLLTIIILTSCTPRYFNPLSVKEYNLGTRIKEKELSAMDKIPKFSKEDFYDTYTFSDSLIFKDKKYPIRYSLRLYKGELKSYQFRIKSDPELYYAIVKEISKKGKFEIDTSKIKYRYYLKQKTENIYLDYKANLTPLNGDVCGGKELPLIQRS